MNDDDFSSQKKSVRERLQEKIGFCPKGIFKLKVISEV